MKARLGKKCPALPLLGTCCLVLRQWILTPCIPLRRVPYTTVGPLTTDFIPEEGTSVDSPTPCNGCECSSSSVSCTACANHTIMYFWVTVYTKSSAGCTIIDGSAGPAILKGPVLQHYMHAGVGQVKVAMWPDYPGVAV